jgi:hypothetical protein
MSKAGDALIVDLVSKGICFRSGLTGDFEKVLLAPSGQKQFNWLVGQYSVLCQLSKLLRSDRNLQASVAGLNVRFGFRKTDVPPTDEARQTKYGSMEAGEVRGFSGNRVASKHEPLSKHIAASHRISDKHSNVERFWATQTAQAQLC